MNERDAALVHRVVDPDWYPDAGLHPMAALVRNVQTNGGYSHALDPNLRAAFPISPIARRSRTPSKRDR
jgi:hypothetical protein